MNGYWPKTGKGVKVLFLDIDGVVNNQNNFSPTAQRTPYPIDSYCAFLVGRIQIQTDCEVVLSSSWRHYPDAVKIVSDSVVKLLDKTPDVVWDKKKRFARGREWPHELRGDEVNAWLEKHPEVTKYAILDDDGDFYDDQPLFQTTFKEGLTDEIAEKVIEHLGRV
jgi:Swiss Army Knife RNA repair-like protein